MDINFEFLYFGIGRHLSANYEILDKPFETLIGLGGIESVAIVESGTDHIDSCYHCSFSYIFKKIVFPGHFIETYCTREERPDHEENPAYITRIRLGKYDFNDPFSKEVSEALKELPGSDK